MKVLGIETSCDETSAAVIDDGKVLSNVISSQLIHREFGGVVPELASRAHQRLIIGVVDEALRRGEVARENLDGIAATRGPGLVGALLVGLSFGKGLAFALGRPFVGVNHMEGHLYSNFLTQPAPAYPFVSLVVSGGHTMLVYVKEPLHHTLLGQTRDDAAGEAYDKVAKMLGLGYPGGAVIDRLAASGDPQSYDFPRSYLEKESFDFSFSGLKTAVLYHLRREGVGESGAARERWDDQHMADVCASFQAAVVDVLVKKTLDAAGKTGVTDIGVAGGVAANSSLRVRMTEGAIARGWRVFIPRQEYCMDNGAMIAFAGWMRLTRSLTSDFHVPAVAHLELSGETE